MARTYQPVDLVALPRMTAVSALALLRSTLSAADGAGKLPPPIEEARAELQTLHDALREAVRTRPVAINTDSPQTRLFDLALDNSWAALLGWLVGWSKLPDEYPQAASATSVITRLFSEGLKFTQLPYALEWAESDSRLETIKKEKLEGIISELGGAPFLANLRKAHKAYGEALGITTAIAHEETQSATRVRDALDDATAALRTFVVRVSAHVRKSDPKTAQLAEALLAPLASWESSAGTARGEEQAAETTTPGASSEPQ